MREVFSAECHPGINSYVNNLGGVWKPLYNLMKNAEKHVESSAADVPVYIYATAGMRVLSSKDQKAIYDAIYSSYLHSDLHFYMRRDMLQTIDGEMEALYGWITVNVLNGRITPSLKYTRQSTIGSLDLGGESTQIAYQYSKRREGEKINFDTDLFFHSFLSFGAKEAQFRYENYILSNREAFRDAPDSRSNRLHIPNPCNNEGLLESTTTYEDLVHEGTGNFDKCESILAQLIRGDTPCKDTQEKKCSIWSMHIPSAKVNFIGMSLYFFVVDFVKTIYRLGEDAQPSIDELKSYGRAFCSMRWEDVLAQYAGVHQYTSNEVLKQRCFQIAYVVTLLEQGYRLEESTADTDPSEQTAVTVDFLRRINGESVDWTYGAALFMGRDPVPKQINFYMVVATLLVLFVLLVLYLLAHRTSYTHYKRITMI